MKLRKVFLLVLAAILVTGTLAAYGGAETQTATLRFSWWGGDARHEATLKAIEIYMERNPNVVIEGEFGGWDGYEDKLATQMAGGTTPDIVQVTPFRMKEFGAKNNVFVNLNDYSSILDISGFDESFLENFCMMDGELLGLPTGLNAHNIFYNTTIHEEAGLSFPAEYDWEYFINEGRKVHENNSEQYFFCVDKDYWHLLLRSYIKQRTGNWFINDDYTIGATRESLVEAFAILDRCMKEGVAEPADTGTQYAVHENPLYLYGNMGAVYLNSSSLGQYQTDKFEIKPRLIPILEDAVATGVIVQPSQCFSASKGDNIEQAVDFINFLFNDAEAIVTLSDVRGTPATSNGRELLESENMLDKDVSDAVSINLAKGVEPVNTISEDTAIKNVFMDIVEQLFFQQISPEDAADKCLQGWENALEDLK